MKDLHPSQALLAGYVRDELPSPRRRKISRHVDGCPVCQHRLGRLEREADQAAEAIDYDGAFRRVAETVRPLKESVDEEARCSASLLPELLKEPSERRLARIAGEPRFHVLKLCHLLQHRTRADWFQEPVRGLESARLAVAIADHLDEGRYGSGVVAEERARAWALLGNSWRITRNLHNAEHAFNQAARHLQLAGDPLVEGEILALTASLRFTQGRSEDSIALLDRSIRISRELGDSLQEGRTLILKGRVLTDAGRHREALRVLRKARLRLSPETNLEAWVVALHNLLTCLTEMGCPLEAEKVLQQERHYYLDLGRPRLVARLLWVEGLIAESRGNLDSASRLFRQARERFENKQLSCEWALVSFRLAMVLGRQVHLAEERHLLEEIIPVLDFLEVRPEAGIARMIYLGCRRS
jgi:tetratricopeptide (TPR) repeat protein